MNQQMMIEAAALSKRYGETQALDKVDLEVPAGSILGVLGPNGAGKTTGVRILTTLTAPDSGRAWVAGHDVVTDAPAVRRKIGVTGQDATLGRDAHGPPEPGHGGPAQPPGAFTGAQPGSRAARPVRVRRRRRPRGQRLLRRHAPPPRPGRQPGRCGRRSSFWTSPPPASIPPAGSACGA